jgi:hypothetical protein
MPGQVEIIVINAQRYFLNSLPQQYHHSYCYTPGKPNAIHDANSLTSFYSNAMEDKLPTYDASSTNLFFYLQ